MNIFRNFKLVQYKNQLNSLFSKSFSTASQAESTIDAKEVETFSKVHDWWDPYGSMRPLHAYNYARINYMRKIIEKYATNTIKNRGLPFKGFDIVDVGCGGGILCEVIVI